MNSDESSAIVRIKLAKIEGPRWNDQKEAVKATGAIFQENTKAWIIETDKNALPVDAMNRLYEIAADYGTQVRLIIFRD